jgi:hypothetical protein
MNAARFEPIASRGSYCRCLPRATGTSTSSGMTGFLSKPFDVDAVIAIIIKLTGHESQSAPGEMTDSTPIQSSNEQDLPGLAVGLGLTVWSDPTVYKQCLRKFVHDYADISQHYFMTNSFDNNICFYKTSTTSRK